MDPLSVRRREITGIRKKVHNKKLSNLQLQNHLMTNG